MFPTHLLARMSRILSYRTAISTPSIYRHVRTLQPTRNFAVSSIISAAAAKKPATAERPSRLVKKSAAEKTKSRRVAPKKKASAKRKAPRKKKEPVKKKKIVLRGRPELQPPKRPSPPFMTFFKHHIEASKRPEGMNGRVFANNATKEAAAIWKSLPEQEKQTFRDQYAAALAEHNKQMEEYIKNTDPAVLKEINRRRALTKKNKIPMRLVTPGRTNAFMQFCAEQRAMRPTPVGTKQLMEHNREFGRAWNTLSDAEKDTYRQLAREKNAANGL